MSNGKERGVKPYMISFKKFDEGGRRVKKGPKSSEVMSTCH